MPIPNPERLLALLQAFINAPSWAESRRIVEGAPELLTDEADALLARTLEQYRQDPRAVQVLTDHRQLLRRCREVGAEAAFGEKMGLPAGVDPRQAAAAQRAMAALPEALRREVAELIEREGVSSPEEFEAALARHPELRERLAQAAQQAGGSGRGVEVPAEFAADVAELQEVPAHLPREPRLAARWVGVLERMLARPELAGYPAFRAAVLNNLGNAYLQLPTGDRGANLARAIACYEQALTVYTPQAWPERARDVARHLGSAHFATRDWPAAHRAFTQARALSEQFYLDALLQEVQEQEIGANAGMIAQHTFCLACLGDTSAAWTSLEAGRARALREGLDRARARRA